MIHIITQEFIPDERRKPVMNCLDWIFDSGKPAERPVKKRPRKKDDPLLTVRSDLLGVREALLNREPGIALGLVGHTLDCIDEYIAEERYD